MLPFLQTRSALIAYGVHLLHVHRGAEVRALATRVDGEVDADLQRRIHGLQALSAATTTAGALRDAHPCRRGRRTERRDDREGAGSGRTHLTAEVVGR